MTNDPRSALNRLIAAFEAHLDAAVTGDEESPAVVAAENALQDVFFTYDDALFTAYGIELPFDIVDSEGDEDDYDEDDDEYDDYDEDGAPPSHGQDVGMADGAARPPTLKDIAGVTGLSMSTVSRALNGSPRIGRRTRERIEREAARLGYQADLAGSLLRAARPRNIGLICRLDQELHFTYHNKILAEADERELRVIVQSIGESLSARRAVRALNQLRCRAAIVVDPGSIDGVAGADIGMHLVFIGQEAPVAGADLVTSDNRRGMREIAEHLAALGHRRVIYLDGPEGRSAAERRSAFREAVGGASLEYEIVAAGARADDGYGAASRLLDPGGSAHDGSVSAMICYNDQCAQGAMVAILRSGRTPGRDISLTGCDNSRIASSRAFNMTSIDRGPAEVARIAVELASRRLDDASGAEPERRSVATRMVVRGSTGAVGGGR